MPVRIWARTLVRCALLVRGLSVVTRNVDDFKRFGVSLINPFTKRTPESWCRPSGQWGSYSAACADAAIELHDFCSSTNAGKMPTSVARHGRAAAYPSGSAELLSREFSHTQCTLKAIELRVRLVDHFIIADKVTSFVRRGLIPREVWLQIEQDPWLLLFRFQLGRCAGASAAGWEKLSNFSEIRH
jgi:hypothetical protein